jgi:hypothetical protein
MWTSRERAHERHGAHDDGDGHLLIAGQRLWVAVKLTTRGDKAPIVLGPTLGPAGTNQSFVSRDGRTRTDVSKLKDDRTSDVCLKVFTRSAAPTTLSWFIRSYNVDDIDYMYVNGTLVSQVPYLGSSGWIDVTRFVQRTGDATTLRFLTWNGPAATRGVTTLAWRVVGHL